MRRMTIRSRITPLNHKGCPKRLLRGIRRNFFRLSPCYGQVSYVLLTRAPVASRRIATPLLPLDLHVLSLSLAFILSQDQTLRCCILFLSSFQNQKKGKTHYNVSAFADAARAARIVRPGCIPELLAVYCVLRIERSR